MDEYRDWLERRGRSAGTVDRYLRTLREYNADPEGVEHAITSRKYSPNYRRFLMAVLRSWATFNRNSKLLDWLDEIKRPPPTPTSEREPLSAEVWGDVISEIENAEYLTDAERAICSLVALRGIRCGDAVRMTRKQLKTGISTGTLSYVGKGGRLLSCSSVPLEAPISSLLACFQNSGVTVCRELVSPLSRDPGATQESATRRIRRKLDSVADSLEMPRADLHPHLFRHTYATLFLQELKGDPEALPKLVQQMGWSNLNTAANYLRRDRRPELDSVESKLHRKMRKKR